MKSLLIISLLFLSVVLSSFTGTPEAQRVEIRISGIEQREGNLIVAIFNSRDSFLKEDYWSRLYPLAEGDHSKILIDNLPEGEYAISIVHDRNGNGELDTNFLGIPKEPFGFSNNPVLKIGPPSFADSKFTHRREGSALDIALTTFRR